MFLLPGSSEEAVVELINQQNPSAPIAFEKGDLYFGKVRDKGDGSGRIVAPAAAMYDTSYDGYANLDFKRIDLTAVFGDTVPVISDLGQNDLHLLLPAINKALGTNFQPEDFVNVILDWLTSGEQVNIRLTPRTNSLGYQGTFIVRYLRNRKQLDVAITTKSLHALTHPGVHTPGKMQLDMATWGLDLSDVYKDFDLWNGVWNHLTLVKQHMADFGFPDWPQAAYPNYVKDMPTSKVVGANTKFSNVLIQPLVVSGDYAGTAYLHYNRI